MYCLSNETDRWLQLVLAFVKMIQPQKRSIEDLNIIDDTINVSHNNDDYCTPKYIGHELDPLIARQLRTLCLAVILIRAGLEMDPVALYKLSGMVLRATFIPCFVEAAAVACLSYFLLDFPLTIGLMLGFVLAAVSPAVIIPCLISIADRWEELNHFPSERNI